jgi:hypothetical protein
MIMVSSLFRSACAYVCSWDWWRKKKTREGFLRFFFSPSSTLNFFFENNSIAMKCKKEKEREKNVVGSVEKIFVVIALMTSEKRNCLEAFFLLFLHWRIKNVIVHLFTLKTFWSVSLLFFPCGLRRFFSYNRDRQRETSTKKVKCRRAKKGEGERKRKKRSDMN